jgi:DNA repair exonuclease SbcCD ATPase subunit
MEDRSQAGLEELTGDVDRLWQEQRQKATEFLSAQKTYLDDLESRLGAELEQIGNQLTAALEHEANGHVSEIERLKAELESHKTALARLEKQAKQDLHDREEYLRAQHAELASRESERDAELNTLRQQIKQKEYDVAHSVTEHESLREKLEQAKSELETARAGRQASAAVEAQIAELRKQNEELAAKLAAAKAERAASTANVSEQIAELQAETKRFKEELRAATELNVASERELAQLRAAQEDLSRHAGDSAETKKEIARLREIETQVAELRAKLNQTSAELNEANEKTAVANEQIAELQKQLESATAKGGESSSPDEQLLRDLEKKHELAMDDVRNLKRRNAELEEKIVNLKSGGGAASSSHSASSWEAMKERMLAELEAETDETPERKKEKLAIEDAIRMTDDVVTQKIKEIEELKTLLDQQSHTVADVAVGAAAINEIFDQDELIRQERERLQQAQEEWREKLRQAEVEISVERARIARERAEFEEKLRAIEAERSQVQTGGSKQGKPARGRWLERLGLKDSDK